MRPSLLLLMVAMVLCGCMPAGPADGRSPRRLLASGNLNNLYVAVAEDRGDRPVFRFWQRDARGTWHACPTGQGAAVAVTAWREHLMVFFATGRWGLFGPGQAVVHPSPVAAWTPVAVCEDGLAADAFGWNAAGDPIYARYEDGKWSCRRIEAALERDRAIDLRAVRSAGRFYLLWREEVPTLTGPGPTYRLRVLFLENDRWQGPITSRLKPDSAPHVASDGRTMICVYRVASAGQTEDRWALATYSMADEDFHETCFLQGVLKGAPIALARSGSQFFLASLEGRRAVIAPLDIATGRVGDFAAPLVAPPKQPQGTYGSLAMLAVMVLSVVLLAVSWHRARRLAGPPAQVPAPAPGTAYAPLGRRAVALAIDYLIVSLAMIPFILRLAPDLPERVLEGEVLAWQEMAVLHAIRLGLILVYFCTTEGLFGRTLGKRVLGLVVRADDGRRAAWWQIVVRNLLRVVDELPAVYLLAVMLVIVGPRPQRLGDRFARTSVFLVSWQGSSDGLKQ